MGCGSSKTAAGAPRKGAGGREESTQYSELEESVAGRSRFAAVSGSASANGGELNAACSYQRPTRGMTHTGSMCSDLSTVTATSNNTKITLRLSSDGSMLEVETEDLSEDSAHYLNTTPLTTPEDEELNFSPLELDSSSQTTQNKPCNGYKSLHRSLEHLNQNADCRERVHWWQRRPRSSGSLNFLKKRHSRDNHKHEKTHVDGFNCKQHTRNIPLNGFKKYDRSISFHSTRIGTDSESGIYTEGEESETHPLLLPANDQQKAPRHEDTDSGKDLAESDCSIHNLPEPISQNTDISCSETNCTLRGHVAPACSANLDHRSTNNGIGIPREVERVNLVSITNSDGSHDNPVGFSPQNPQLSSLENKLSQCTVLGKTSVNPSQPSLDFKINKNSNEEPEDSCHGNQRYVSPR